VWRLKAGGHGWLRDLEGIITADAREAHQFATPAAARAVARRLRMPVGLRVIEGLATQGYRRGL